MGAPLKGFANARVIDSMNRYRGSQWERPERVRGSLLARSNSPPLSPPPLSWDGGDKGGVINRGMSRLITPPPFSPRLAVL